MNKEPLISLIVPCRNEKNFIGPCLDSILANKLPEGRLEVLVVDGVSDDGTRDIVQDYVNRHPNIRLIDNPAQVTPPAMNLGIRHSRGEIIARLDAHSTCEPNYLAKCLATQRETGADNVGGLWHIRPRQDTPIGRAIAISLAHPFGSANARYKTGSPGRCEVDTVPFGFYRREVFAEIGGFNEGLVRGQDMELNLRLRRAGGRILLDPAIVSEYFARSNLWAYLRHNFADGFWITYASRFAKLPVTWRHLVPLIFVLSLAGSLLFWPAWSPFGWLFAMILGLYLTVSIGFSVGVAVRQWRAEYFFTMPVVFAVRHFAMGFGSLCGMVKLLVTSRRAKPSINGPTDLQSHEK